MTVSDPKMRIYLMLGALVLLGAIVFGLNVFSSKTENRDPRHDVPTKSAGPLEGEVDFSGTPPLDPRFKDKIADKDEDDRKWWQSDVMHYLLLEAANTPAVHEFSRNLVPVTPANAPGIRTDSAPWRYKYVRFRGKLDYVEEINYEDVYGDTDPPIGQVKRGRIRLADSPDDNPVHIMFVTPGLLTYRDTNEPVPHPELREIKDGWVRGRGIFVKNYVDEHGRGHVPSFLVVATKIERDYETVDVETLDDIPFDMIRDNPELVKRQNGRLILAKEFPRPLYRLVKYAEKRAGRAGAELRAKENLKPAGIDGKEEYEAMYGDPAAHRAKYYGGLGAIAVPPYTYGPADITPNDAGVDSCINGWLVTDRNKLVQFVGPASLSRPFKKNARIRYEGYFYKTKLYRAIKGTDEIVPMLVLTVLEEVKLPKPNYVPQIIVAGAFILGMVLLLFIVLREDKTKESYRRQFRKRAAEADAAKD